MVVSVPVRPVNWTRPSSRGALILQAIMSLHENRVWPREISGFRPSQDTIYGKTFKWENFHSVNDFFTPLLLSPTDLSKAQYGLQAHSGTVSTTETEHTARA